MTMVQIRFVFYIKFLCTCNLSKFIFQNQSIITIPDDDEEENKNKVNVKPKTSKLRVPPIIEPHIIQTKKTPEKKVQSRGKRKNQNDSPAVKKLKTNNEPKPDPQLTKTDKTVIVEKRKQKLKELTQKKSNSVDVVSHSKTQPKVKVRQAMNAYRMNV